MGFLEIFWVFLYVFRGVPGFLEGVPGFSHCSGCSGVFRGVPGCAGVPCSGVPVFLELLHAIFDTSFRFSQPFYGKWHRFVQLVNAIPERHSPVLDSVYHLPKPQTVRGLPM